jgi:hypothetical protein
MSGRGFGKGGGGYTELSGGGVAAPLLGADALSSPAARRLAVLGVDASAPVDEGFSGGAALDKSALPIEVLTGARDLDLSQLQTEMSPWQQFKSGVVIMLAAASGVGLAYLCSKVTLVRQGEVALVRSLAGECRALGPGWHLFSTVGCDVTKAAQTDAVIRLGNLCIVRVFPGYVGMGQLNGNPLLLAPGVHLLNDPLFSFLGTALMTQPVISVGGTLHVITVPRGMLGLCTADSQGHFLGPGRHVVSHPRFAFLGLRSATDEHLSVGSKHRVLLAAGRLGLAWEAGRPLVLEAGTGVFTIDSPTFSFERSVNAATQVITHGSTKLVTVRQAFVGVSFKDGHLDVLPPGRSVLESVTHTFSGFLPTGQITLPLEKVQSMTRDNVPLEFDAAITVQIVDPSLAIIALSGTTGAAQQAAKGGDDAFNSGTIWTACIAKA